MYLNIRRRNLDATKRNFDYLLAVDDYDLDPIHFQIGDTFLLDLQTHYPETLDSLEVRGIDGIRLIRKMPTLTSSQFQDTIQFDLRVVGRVHHLRRRYEGDQGMPEMRHSTTIIVEAVSDQVEQILAEVLVVLESEDNLYQDLKNQGMTGI